MLTEKQAWKKIAPIFRRKRVRHEDFRRKAFTFYKMPCVGMCGAIAILRRKGLISYEVCYDMRDRIDTVAAARRGKDKWNPYLYPTTKRGDVKRVKFCLKQALDCAD